MVENAGTRLHRFPIFKYVHNPTNINAPSLYHFHHNQHICAAKGRDISLLWKSITYHCTRTFCRTHHTRLSTVKLMQYHINSMYKSTVYLMEASMEDRPDLIVFKRGSLDLSCCILIIKRHSLGRGWENRETKSSISQKQPQTRTNKSLR